MEHIRKKLADNYTEEELLDMQREAFLREFPPDIAEMKAIRAVELIKTGKFPTPEEAVENNKPGVLKLATNFMKAVTRYAKSGGEKVDEETFKSRMSECDKCVFRQGNRCTHSNCGCFLDKKASWKSESCPISRW